MSWLDWMPPVCTWVALLIFARVWRLHTRRMDHFADWLEAHGQMMSGQGAALTILSQRLDGQSGRLAALAARLEALEKEDAPGGSRGVRNIEPEGADPS
ncbi:hypothetical protein GCM10009527_098030 [Actinomadura nitritigenes]|uniref:Uncharacterized protein n=1 Tax=Actinomadura nitritigenes TaxID=134602 RepID=A0ABS3QWZ3_9ACTN|nr:hypothetical protein [Actinomadura nitritigenes]MBO2438287.1 hypothetical protein [Actinomadura nitritigenes]